LILSLRVVGNVHSAQGADAASDGKALAYPREHHDSDITLLNAISYSNAALLADEADYFGLFVVLQ
jgi:hypothetical protein